MTSPALSHVKVSWRRGELRVPACYQAWRFFLVGQAETGRDMHMFFLAGLLACRNDWRTERNV